MKTKELLEEVVNDRLKQAANEGLSDEERSAAFDEAMRATDRLVEVGKIESDKDKNINRALKYLELFAIPVALMGVDYLFKMKFTKTVCLFEKDYTFTTQAGRSVSQFFNFKRK